MRKRSKYRPRVADPGAMQRCLNKFQPFTEKEIMLLDMPLRISFAALKSGTAVLRDVEDLMAALNTTLVRSRAIHPVCVEASVNAIMALARAAERHRRTGVLGLDGDGITALGVALDLHRDLCQLSSPIQMVEALKQVMENKS